MAEFQTIRKKAVEFHIPDISQTMIIKILFAGLLLLSFTSASLAQTLDKAKLDQFFDRLAEQNKAMGRLVVAKHGNVLYTCAIGSSH